MHGQEIRLVAQLGDQGQFMLHHATHPRGCTARIAPLKPRLRQPPQPLRGGLILGNLAGIFIAQFIQRKIQPRRQCRRTADRPLMPRKKAAHLLL